jgi:hypothetical protein
VEGFWEHHFPSSGRLGADLYAALAEIAGFVCLSIEKLTRAMAEKLTTIRIR